MVVLRRPCNLRASSWALAMGMKRTFLTGLPRRPKGTSRRSWPKALMPTAAQKPKGYGLDMHHQGANFAAGGLADRHGRNGVGHRLLASPRRLLQGPHSGLILATAEEWGIFCGALAVLGRWGLVWLQHKTRPVPRIRADGPNQVWSWDISYLPTSVKGIWLYLYFAMDGGAGRWWPGMWRTSKSPNLLSILLAGLVRESGLLGDAISH